VRPSLAQHNLDQTMVWSAGEVPWSKAAKGRHIVGLKPDSILMNYGNR